MDAAARLWVISFDIKKINNVTSFSLKMFFISSLCLNASDKYIRFCEKSICV